MATIIITEKKSVSREIVRALKPDSFDDRDSCDCEHNFIVSARNPKEPDQNKYVGLCAATEVRDKERQYFCSNDCGYCKFYAEHIDSEGKRHYAGTKKRLSQQNKVKSPQERTIFEDISYFVFPFESDIVIVADTNGNPLSTRVDHTGRRSLEQLFRETGDWADIVSRIRQVPNFDVFGGKSSQARIRLFNHLLAKKRLPSGEPINVRRVIAATDYDTAGTYIFYSLIQNANDFMSGHKNAKKITPDMIYRMALQSMDPHALKQELKHPLPFDYQNAAAGEVRALFDTCFGSTLTAQLNYSLGRLSPNKCNVSVGRNQCLALEALIDEEKTLGATDEKTYLVFRGIQDLDTIRTNLASQNFVGLQITTKKARVSQSEFLKTMQSGQIGTHTTRQKIPMQLASKDVAEVTNLAIRTTPFGLEYFDIIRPYIRNSQFDLKIWNSVLQEYMENLQSKPLNFEDLENASRVFLRNFHEKYKLYLRAMNPRWPEISKRISDAYQRYAGNKTNGRKKDSSENPPRNGLELTGLDTHLDLDQIRLFMNESTNSPTDKNAKIVRRIPRPQISYEESVRRICCIGRAFDLEVTSGDPSALADFDREENTVFVADDVTLENFVRGSREIHSYEKTEFTKKERKEMIDHEPLNIKDIDPGNISGDTGFNLVREYNAPWMHNHLRAAIESRGKVDISSFESDIGKFRRVSWYEIGMAHNYETLLIAMLEKYGLPFKSTAELAEDLYLGS